MSFRVFFSRALTIEKPMPQIPVPIRFRPRMPGQQEVDVARALLVDERLARRRPGPGGPRAALDRVVHLEAGDARVGPRRVEVVDERRRRLLDEQRDLAGAQRLEARRRASGRPPASACRRARAASGRARRRRRPGDDADRDRVGRLVAEREAEDERHEDREGEDPEERLGLADELEHPRPRERDEGMLRRSLIAQLPSGQGDEDVLERRPVRRERDELRAGAVERGEQRRHGLGERGRGQEPAAVALPALADARDRGEQVLGRPAGSRRELDDVRRVEAGDELGRACPAR